MPQKNKYYSNKTTFYCHKLAEQSVKILIWLTLETFLFLYDIQFDRCTISTFSTEKYNHTFYETLMLLDSRRHLENYATHTRHSRLSNIRTSVSCQEHYETRMTITNRSHTELNTTPHLMHVTERMEYVMTWAILHTQTMFCFQFLCI